MQQWQRRHKKPRRYRLRSRLRPFRREWLAVLLGAAIQLFGLIRLIGYGRDWLAARNTSGELQNIYYDAPADTPAFFTAEPTAEPADTPVLSTAEPTAVATPDPTAAETAEPIEAAAATSSPLPGLEAMGYPDNPGLTVSSRWKALRRENRDIMGWLNMDRLLDEPVVQRDDVFYLTHDAAGRENVNGAIFLEASVGIHTRPYTYILYGHNMKTGAMFGCLRNYENRNFYHASPFITFDTVYEDGRYVIFAVGSISTEAHERHYVDFHDLKSTDRERRKAAIDALISASVFTCPVDVRADDQVLLLVTCTEKDQERRVVAARRIRDDEEEAALGKKVERSRKK